LKGAVFSYRKKSKSQKLYRGDRSTWGRVTRKSSRKVVELLRRPGGEEKQVIRKKKKTDAAKIEE